MRSVSSAVLIIPHGSSGASARGEWRHYLIYSLTVKPMLQLHQANMISRPRKPRVSNAYPISQISSLSRVSRTGPLELSIGASQRGSAGGLVGVVAEAAVVGAALAVGIAATALGDTLAGLNGHGVGS